MSDINVTPMVDVMLVLLIVFMVAAPLLTVGVPIDLPKTDAKEMNTPAKPVTVSVDQKGEVFVGQDSVTLDTLVTKLASVEGAADQKGDDPTQQRVLVRGDQNADYGQVMKVMGVLSAAGYSKIGLITEQQQQGQ
jgi:biopolymer transport protein TolR